ncbi:MAG: NAD(P)-dependent glycerol-3-phosphate dehydrogenase [Coriobacteriia bacterium]|nr:NAD(P)-dependent glycerol-3-phosphate dehydrogenase [Coriobacteriia bacterium]
MTRTVAVVGAGSWGTAVAWMLGGKGHDVRLWARRPETAEAIEAERRNPRYLTDVLLPETVGAYSDLARATSGAELVVIVTPSHGVREAAGALRPLLSSEVPVVSLAKGLERGTLLRMTEVLAEELGGPERLAALSGPNHAEEVSRGIPSATVAAAHDEGLAAFVRDAFMTPFFRVYTNPDIVGVELCGASKNVIAVAAGISDGLGFGDNTKASLMTRGLAEMSRLGKTAGARQLTFMGLAGMGDLIATCTSRHSRNRSVGEAVGKGGTVAEWEASTRMVAEGTTAALTIGQLAGRYGVELPITSLVRRILYEGLPAREAVEKLMTRTAVDEMHGMGLLEGGERR